MLSATVLEELRTKTAVTVLLGVAWLLVVALSFGLILKYETTPGRIGTIPAAWPLRSHIHRSTDQPTLVMVAHPYCPCSRASIGELARVMAQVSGKASAYVVFIQPNDQWRNSDLQRSAAAIPGVTVLTDRDGTEAAAFGAETSGHTLLFDRRGHLLFSGGLTSSRGHSGDNAGERAVISLINNRPLGRIASFVFGCALTNESVNNGQ